jgi:hypothetical protein
MPGAGSPRAHGWIGSGGADRFWYIYKKSQKRRKVSKEGSIDDGILALSERRGNAVSERRGNAVVSRDVPEWLNSTDQRLFLVDLCVLADFSYNYTRNGQHLRRKPGGCAPVPPGPWSMIYVSLWIGRSPPQPATSN